MSCRACGEWSLWMRNQSEHACVSMTESEKNEDKIGLKDEPILAS